MATDKFVIDLATGAASLQPLTPAEVADQTARSAEAVARKTAEDQAAADNTTIRNAVIAAAQSAVGVSIADLTTIQRWGLMGILLWKAGAIKPDNTIRPLGEWAK